MPMPTQIAIPQIKWGKRKERSQMSLIRTEDGRIVEVELDVLYGSMHHPNLPTQDGWEISPENLVYDARDGVWKQLLNDKSAVPICLFEEISNEEAEKRAGDVFEDALVSAQIQRFKDVAKSIIWQKIEWIVAIAFGSFIIIAAMRWLGGG